MDLELDRPLDRVGAAKGRQMELTHLKKKNHELSTITRKLEEKVKNLEKVSQLLRMRLFIKFRHN